MKVFCCQLDLAWEDKPANYKKARHWVQTSGIPAGSLLVLPEMFPTGFSMNVTATQEGTPSKTESFLQGLALEYGVFVLSGLVGTGTNGRPRNQAVVFSPDGQELARYSKIHPFTLGGEAASYAAGTEIALFNWRGCTVAPFICYDLRFPEVFRAAVQRGAHVFAVIANWPVKRERHWLTLLQARAIENQAYVAGVNRCGKDPQFSYSGRTTIVDPHGIVLAGLGDREGMVMADVELDLVNSWRKEFPALQDMHWKG